MLKNRRGFRQYAGMTQLKREVGIKKKVLLFPQKPAPKYFVRVKSQKGFQLKLADPKINRLALALMDMQAVLGGAASHWGGPSAFAEVASALYGLAFYLADRENRPYYELFHIINDAGHAENGLYALKANYGMGDLDFSELKGFRSLKSRLTGHGEAHLFPEGVYLSNGPLASTLAQAEGLCMADKLSGLKRVTLVLMSDGALMEGEAKEALCSIPGFFQKGKMNPFVVIVSDNDTKLSGRISEDSFSMEPFFNSVEALGWECVELKKAHDLKACVDILEETLSKKEFKKPVFIRAKTIKGYGVKQTEKASHGGHGFPLKNTEKLMEFLAEINKDIPDEFAKWAKALIKQDQKSRALKQTVSFQKAESFSNQKEVKVQEGIGKALIHCRKELGLPVVSISADLQGSTGVLPFRKKFPELSFDMGVAEANMISVASGFSKQGFIPVVDTFTQFGVTKGALPLFMANLSLAPVIAVFSHAGFQDAADGASHQCLTYLSSSLPMTDLYCLSSSAEAFSLITQAVKSFAEAGKKTPRSQIFFLGRETFPASYLPEDYPYKLGKAQVVYSHLKNRRGKALTLWALGPLLREAFYAGQMLVKKGFRVITVNASIVNKPDMETLLDCLKKTDFRLLTVEDHRLTGGMASIVAHKLARVKTDMESMGVKSDFGRSALKSFELYKKEKLTARDIVETALKRF